MSDLTFPETSTSFLTALFKHPRNAENIYHELLKKGYKKEEIILIMSKDTQKQYFSNGCAIKNTVSSKTLERMGIGAAMGGMIGGLISGVAATASEGAFVLPGSEFIIVGPLMAGFAGAGAGGIIGGLVGAFMGAEIPEINIKKYETGIQEGGVIIGVTPLNSLEHARLQSEWMASDE